jgi:cytidine deaminase
MPCGACRQVISEFMGPDGIVVVDSAGSFSVKELLPVSFNLEGEK